MSFLKPSGLDESKFFSKQVHMKTKATPDSYDVISEKNHTGISTCTVHITCETAKTLKKKLQEHICSVNTNHNKTLEKLINMDTIYKELPQEIKNNLKSLEQELHKAKLKIDETRNTSRLQKIYLKEYLDCSVFLQHFREPIKAKIMILEPKNNAFDIKYIDENKKEKIVTGIKFGQLCIGESNENITKPDQSCILEHTKCEMTGGGDPPLITDDLC